MKTQPDSAKFTAAMVAVTMGQMGDMMKEAFSGVAQLGDEDAVSVRPPHDTATMFVPLCRALNGRTGGEIITHLDEIRQQIKDGSAKMEREEYVHALTEAKTQAKTAQDSLIGFRVLSVKVSQHRNVLDMMETLVSLDVENQTTHSLSRVELEINATTPGREIPWVHANIRYAIPGGLAPGEKAHWDLEPNMFNDAWKTPIPSSAVISATPVELDDPSEKPLWGGARFTKGDQALLDSLSRH